MNDSLSTLILIYFIYGLAFYTLGIGAILQANNRYKAYPLVEAIPFLGLFGLFHGILEWLIMLSYTSIFASNYNSIRTIIGILGTASFAFLWLFAAKLVFSRVSHQNFKFISFLVVVVSVATHVFGIAFWDFGFSVRVLMGAPSAISAGLGLIVITKDKYYGKLKGIRHRLYAMAGLLIAYGATQLMTQNDFQRWFGLRIELGRTILAVLLTISFVSVIRIIKWENEKRMSYLIARQGIGEEQKRIAREMHDVVLQDLFSIGLQLEQLEEQARSAGKPINIIEQLKSSLNGTMESIRGFIKTSMFEKNDICDLYVKLQSMVMSLQDNHSAQIVLRNPETEIEYGFLELEEVNHIYYIVRESVINALKHSGCTIVLINIKSTLTGLRITISDDGCGFNVSELESKRGMGIKAMIERMNIVSGEIHFKSSEAGTKIDLYLPWEG